MVGVGYCGSSSSLLMLSLCPAHRTFRVIGERACGEECRAIASAEFRLPEFSDAFWS